MKIETSVRYNIEINGIVQGVGFRPYIYNLANKYNLAGMVCNTQDGVQIEIEGEKHLVNQFMEELPASAPILSCIESFSSNILPPKGNSGFIIITSKNGTGNKTFISPDVSVCEDCLTELFQPENRRFNYPFINCTNCGPRYTIIENIPYDRKYTTMNKFQMCDKCMSEYTDPTNRRFHAQPNACPDCGPNIWLEDNNRNRFDTKLNITEDVVNKLLEGSIVAIKGLGGFHLAVDALNENAVKRLRERKGREAKPFAIMLPNLISIQKIANLNLHEENLLTDIMRPIVLLRKIEDISIAESVASSNKRLGIMLPYTPLHYMILNQLQKKCSHDRIPALVMTSANLSEEPIVISNDDARNRLKNIADYYLFHNRDILIRSDDSVVMSVNNKTRVLRRSRGIVPKSFSLLEPSESILAVGAELKNSVCLSKEKHCFISQHIGDLTNLSAYNFFTDTINHMQKIHDTVPKYIARDLHPNYLSSKWVTDNHGCNVIPIQHHHAHMASCMLENKINENVIGIILDGTGYGYDGTIWGGEILIGNYIQFERFANLETIHIAGGDSAIKEPWKIGCAYLYHSFDKKIPETEKLKEYNFEGIKQLLDKKIKCFYQSSAGRLFDAVSFIAGGPAKIRYEAEAAITLTQSVTSTENKCYDYDNYDISTKTIPLKKLLRSIYYDVQNGSTFSEVANRFHRTFANILIEAAIAAREYSTTNKIVLSGGVFQNEILLELVEKDLRKAGFLVFVNSQIPSNDGGISAGQVAIVNQLLNKKLEAPIYQK